MRVARLQLCTLRAIADHPLTPRQVEIEKGTDILLRRHPADIQEHWWRRLRAPWLRLKQSGIHALAPQLQIAQPPLAKLRRHPLSANQHRLTRAMKRAQPGIAPGQRQPRPARGHILGKVGMDGRGKGQPTPVQPTARRPTQRPFGRQVDHVRGKPTNGRPDPPEVPGQGDFRVTGARQMAKILRRQQLDLMAQPLQLRHQSLQTGDYAIDLGQPGVADNQHPHRTGSALVRASAAKLAWRA